MTIVTSTKITATEQGHSLWAGMTVESAGPLAARSGVIGGLALTKTSGMGLQLGTGRGGIQYTTAADGGWVPFTVNAAEVSVFTPGDATKDRIDLVELRIIAGVVTLVVKAGPIPASGSPVFPTIDPDSIPLWYVPIAANTSVGSGGWVPAGAIDARQFIAGGGQAGDIKYNAGAGATEGWLIADGRAVRRDIYATLFARIGTAHGVGDGSTTFQLPDLRQVVAVGMQAGSTEHGTLGQKFGAKTHSHGLGAGYGKISGAKAAFAVVSSWVANYSVSISAASSAGSDTTGLGLGGSTDSTSTIQPSIALTPLIKY